MQAHDTGIREQLDFIWLELTARCNLECVHCYADSSPERPLSEGMTLQDWIGALNQAAALGCKKVQFIGGEPTLHPGLPRLIEHARSIGYEQVCVYTNGTHFTETLKEVFLANRVSLAFSVYGSSGEVHDQVTQRKGSFAKTDRALRWAVQAGLAIRAGVIEMAANSHDVHQSEQMLHEAGVNLVHVDRLRGLGRGSQERPPQSKLKELCGRCGNGKVCVSSNGEIYPCVFARFAALGHIKEEGLATVFGGQSLQEFRGALIDAHGAALQVDSRSNRNAPLDHHGALACSPEQPAPPCSPEIDPGPCNPEIPPPDCNPERDPGPCNPDKTAFRRGRIPANLF